MNDKCTIFSALRNPGTYYFFNVEEDWTAPHNDALWRDGVKTLFDPCPAGWRVPKNDPGALSPWADFRAELGPWSEAEYGRRWRSPLVQGGEAWYPATGMRFYSAGFLNDVQNSAHCQSATAHVGSNGAWVFFFVDTEVITDRVAHRTHGLSVRCVRE